MDKTVDSTATFTVSYCTSGAGMRLTSLGGKPGFAVHRASARRKRDYTSVRQYQCEWVLLASDDKATVQEGEHPDGEV